VTGVTGKVRHRFSRATSLVPLPIDLGPFARSSLHLLAARSALDIPRVRHVAKLVEAELRRVAEPGSPNG
jgi:hypothetical protein